MSEWFGLVAAALAAHHRGGSKKVSKVLGAAPSWFMVHDAYRVCIALGFEPTGAETGWFEPFLEHLRHGVYGHYQGSPRGFIRNYIEARMIYVDAAFRLKSLMSDQLGMHPIEVARTFEKITHGKTIDVSITEVTGFDEAKAQFLNFRSRVDLGV
ncbi:hypothetical protein [Henriciella aquimarina]|uniref:hypothetical protein n=1 Tax=Henriciella aquimarina TaxID=545261 RepID=UPI00117A1B65|nr:hypothetical protein [Henriciella aquimarina]